MSDRKTVIHPPDSCEPAALSLPRLTAPVVRLANAIGGGRSATVPLGDRTLRVRVDREQAEVDAQGEPPVTFHTEYGICNFVPAGAVLRLLTGMSLPNWQDCPDALFRQWSLKMALQRMPAQWQRLFGLRGLAEGIRAPDEASVTIHLEVPGHDLVLAARVSGMPHVLANIFSMDCWQNAARAPARRLNALPMRKPVPIARSRIRKRQLQQVVPGDLLLIDEPLFDEEGAGAIRFGRMEMHGRLLMDGPMLQFEFDQWRVGMDDADFDDHEDYDAGEDDEHHDEQSDDDMSDEEGEDNFDEHDPDDDEAAEEGSDEGADHDDQDNHDEGGDSALDDLPMRLSFEAGKVDVRLAELRCLASGSIIDLGQPVPPAIVIRCNGVETGRGELVEIEGRLAVRVTDIWGQHGR